MLATIDSTSDRMKRADSAPRLKEGILDGVLGLRGSPHNRQRQAIGRRGFEVHETREGPLVAFSRCHYRARRDYRHMPLPQLQAAVNGFHSI
jgi:hypothetical protein